MSEYLTTLNLLRDTRKAAGLNHKMIEAITSAAHVLDPKTPAITVTRLRQLENLPRHEPTYAEARTLARIMALKTIGQLISTSGIYVMAHVFGRPSVDDLATFLTSSEVPLSIACRLTIQLGLDDPLELDSLPIHAQVWDILARGERGAGPGECPWCLAQTAPRFPGDPALLSDHLPTCLPAALWAPRERSLYLTAAFPHAAKPRTRGDSGRAHGLKHLRIAKGITQQNLASDVGLHPNYISRIEVLERPLTQANAIKIAAKLGVSPEKLFEKLV